MPGGQHRPGYCGKQAEWMESQTMNWIRTVKVSAGLLVFWMHIGCVISNWSFVIQICWNINSCSCSSGFRRGSILKKREIDAVSKSNILAIHLILNRGKLLKVNIKGPNDFTPRGKAERKDIRRLAIHRQFHVHKRIWIIRHVQKLEKLMLGW